MKNSIVRAFILAFVLFAMLALPFGQIAVVRAAQPEDDYEFIVPLESISQIYQVSAKHEMMVIERYKENYREPERSLVTFSGEEVLAGTDILLCSYGILYRTREWNEDNTPTELYSFYDWSLDPVFFEITDRIVTTDSHYLLLMNVTNTSAMANLCYGERRLYDLETNEVVMDCGYGSDGDVITIPDGQTITPDRYGVSAFAAEAEESRKYFQTSQIEEIIAEGPLAGTSFSWIKVNSWDDCKYADSNDIAILYLSGTGKSCVIRVLRENTGISFSDVQEDSYCYDAVAWATARGPMITTGYADGTFRPDNDVNRGQAVTFLWRAFGCPEPSRLDNPFTDVDSRSPYFKAILWAVENGITNGTTLTTFEPYTNSNRAHIITFLWRASGRPTAQSTINPFTDVAAGTFYYEAVLWAAENNITQWLATTSFEPAKLCRRGQVVTFIYKALGE